MVVNIQINLVDSISPDSQFLIDRDELGEPFHSECELKFEGRSDGKLIGLIAYRLGYLDSKPCPQFCHVVMSPEFRGKSEVGEFLYETEMELKSVGYTHSYCYILHSKRYMHKSAFHHGYKVLSQDTDGVFYTKLLGG